MIEESEGAAIDGVPGLKPSLGCRKEHFFNMLALEGVVVDRATERIGGAQSKYKKWGPTKWIV